MISVFVVAPTPIAQAGLHAMLSSAEIQVVGTATSPDALSEDILNADVIVMADELQLEEIGRSLTNMQGVALIVLTNNDQRILPQLRALELRGWGAVPSHASAAQLQAAVVAAAQGLVTLPVLSAQLLDSKQSIAEAITLDASSESLTPREREVLELVGQGLPNKLIARRLSISEHTVKFHVSSISAKLGASSRTDAVGRGLRRGLITL
ncbi:MAG: response regulator transcription factor [Chloroflexi bacterium]|nr:response regulator transcription factor [Chloroflexota bacterium]